MPKMKTHSSAKKRFKVTGKGKVMRYQANRQHLMRKKSKNRKNRLSKTKAVDKADVDNIRRLLCK